MSATLIALTAAQDIQTVRQALLALGHARARWASTAIAARLGHPNMNIKRTAAEVLVRAGTPTAVPTLLFWLGHHDNPGLRGTLIEALRTILGDAYQATVLAAAEHSEGGRARELLLEGLDRTLSARSVLALDGQASPVAPTLLALVATGRVRLACGTIEDLSTAMAKHGIPAPAAPPAGADTGADLDVTSLEAEGWRTSVALRIAAREELPHPTRLRVFRPMLPDWLRLAASEPAARGRVLRLTLRLCPAPWKPEELRAFARSTKVLLDGLAEAATEDRHDLLAVLEAVAPTLSAVEKQAVADTVRALPCAPADGPSTLTLLRSLGAVPVRADLDHALASARLGTNPWQAETAVLRDAFAVPQAPPATARAKANAKAETVSETAPETGSESDTESETKAWRAALDAAVRTPAALEEFRRLRRKHDGTIPASRDRLTALIDAYAPAGTEVRAALIDWMTDVQPLDAPPWTITETAHAPAPRPRTVHIDDLDQPRSTALRDRLLAMLQASAPTAGTPRPWRSWSGPSPSAGFPCSERFCKAASTYPSVSTWPAH